jgi:Uma2 family endonuclease
MTLKPATYAELEALPEHLIGEIIGGTLYASRFPPLHGALAYSRLLYHLIRHVERTEEGPGGWLFLQRVELHLGGDVLVPDISGWRRERLPQVPDVPAMTLAPDWVCEVLSPLSCELDRHIKPRAYARERISYMWLVDPDARRLEVLRREGPGYLPSATYTDRAVIHAEPFELPALELGELWALGG